jgi:tRNA A-37 threonylcarbamoyl transferase component Bud32
VPPEGDGRGTDRLLAGRYRVIRELGKGGMGTVWRALDEVLGREVAVKELRTYSDAAGPELAELRRRMGREARAAAQIRHPGVVAVYDIAEHDGRPVIVMELVDGPSLADVIETRGELTPAEAAAIGAKVADALAAAHRAGVLHRDVKPANILLSGDGRAMLTDFGIATMNDPGDGASRRLTQSGSLVGSLEYMAPERAQGREPGPPSDIWSLGATLYAAVEGASPFQRGSTWTTLTAIVTEPLPEPRRCGPLAAVLSLLMDKDPQSRPDAEQAGELLAAVSSAASAASAGLSSGQEEDFGTMGLRPAAAALPALPALPSPSVSPPTEDTEAGGTLRPVPAGPGRTRVARRRRTVIAVTAAAVVLAGAGAMVAFVTHDSATAPPAGAVGRDLALPSVPGGGTRSPGASPSAGHTAQSPTPTGATAASLPHASPTAGAGATATVGTGDDATTGAAAPPATTPAATTAPATACSAAGDGTYSCTVLKVARSYDDDGNKAGLVGKGVRAFSCQADLGRSRTRAGVTTTWWAKTDDDSGNSDVWITDAVIEGALSQQPLSGLPTC